MKNYKSINKKTRGFTLIELLITIAIMSILLIFLTNWVVGMPFNTINGVTRDISIQSGVTATGDMASDILKKSTQIHLVGSNVFNSTLDLQGTDKTKLDNKYSYIAIKQDSFGNRLLYNVTPNNDDDGNIINWNEEPIMATNRKDILKGDQIVSYNLEFYKDDKNYTEKFNNNILSIAITGQTYQNNKISDENKYGKEVVYKKDIVLSNANQILLSKFLNGSIDDITAIAYDAKAITQKTERKVTSGKIAYIMVYDNSLSMTFNTKGDKFVPDKKNFKNTVNNKTYTQQQLISTPEQTPRAYIAGQSSENLINRLHDIAQKSNTDIQSYVFSFSNFVMDYPFAQNRFNGKDVKKASPDKYMKENAVLNNKFNRDYISRLSDVTAYIGPYNLKDTTAKTNLIKYIQDPKQIGMGISLDNLILPSNPNNTGTNTGEAILKAIEIATQLKAEQGYDKVFFVLISDGKPEGATFIKDTSDRIVFLSGAKIARDNRNVLATERILSSIYNWHVYNSSYTKSKTIFSRKENVDMSMMYIDDVTENAMSEYQSKVSNRIFDSSFLIGFSGVSADTEKLEETGKYMERVSEKVTVLRASDQLSLDEAFNELFEDVKTATDLFSGPKTLN